MTANARVLEHAICKMLSHLLAGRCFAYRLFVF
jgi:hypothetical protein